MRDSVLRRNVRRFALLLVLLFAGQSLIAGDPYLVKDINPGPEGAYPWYIVDANAVAYFVANDGTHGWELWRSDGTQSGTLLVKDINPVAPDSEPEWLTAVDGEVYFVANEPIYGRALWKSDGTEDGTVLVKDMDPTYRNRAPTNLTESNGTLFFVYPGGWGTGEPSAELWKYDDTVGDTVMVKDINPLSNSERPSGLYDYNDLLVFSAWDPDHGNELWLSDGTESGTRLVKDINPGSANSNPGNFFNIGTRLYFTAQDEETGYELWTSDGSDAGTYRVKDIWDGIYDSWPSSFNDVDGTLFFTVTMPTTMELWKSNGTEETTERLAGLGYTGHPGDDFMEPLGGSLLYRDRDGETGEELYQIDLSGTGLMIEIRPGSASSYPYWLSAVGDFVYFNANDGSHGYEVWRTDGTPAGTEMFFDINEGSASSSPAGFKAIGETLLFFANDGSHGEELWAVELGSDADGDGINDSVDGQMVGGVFEDDSNEYSHHFTDENIDGVSFGYIQNRAGLTIAVEDYAAGGLILTAEGSGGPARVRVCGLQPPVGRLSLTAGDRVVVTCGSMTMEVEAGPVEVDDIDGAVIVTAPTGAAIRITELGDGEIQIENLLTSTATITITVDGEETTVDTGKTLTLQSISVDIMPGNDTGCINTKKKGVIPAAILGSPTFDVGLVDPATCLLEGMSVKTKGKHGTPLHEIWDVNEDGFADVLMPFAYPGGIFAPDQTTAKLSCALHGEEPATFVSGSDTICMIK